MAKRVTDQQEIANRGALSDFIGYWRDSPDFLRPNVGNRYVQMTVRAVHMTRGEGPVTFETDMGINLHPGNTDGNILLMDTDEVKSQHFHMEYSPVFQTYVFDERAKALNVSGLRYRDNAPYTVQIEPTIQRPTPRRRLAR